VLHKELDADDGELTRPRSSVASSPKNAAIIDALYADKNEQFIETVVKFEDGRTAASAPRPTNTKT
jgi:long-chain acyl-CoA synthetase